MKIETNPFKHLQAFSFLTGMIFGAFVSLMLFSYLVPGGYRAIVYRYNKMPTSQTMSNKREIQRLTDAAHQMNGMNHAAGSNPYMMSPVTSESQFLRDMKLHHEAAVVMAKQVLELKNIHAEVKTLANNIISTQSTEIKMMKDWMTAWK